MSNLSDSQNRRWRELDPLLPPPAALQAGCGARFAVAGDGGDITAIASCVHWDGEPDSMELTWGAARRFRLAVHAAGPDIAAGLDALLAQWRDHLGSLPEAAGADTAAEVDWPSRDVACVAPLLRHGFAPLAVIAARVTAGAVGGHAGPGAAVAAGPAGHPHQARRPSRP